MKLLRWTCMLILLGAAALAQAGALDDATTAIKAMQRGDNAEALKFYTKALNSGELPTVDQATLVTMRGNIYHRTKDFDRAIADFSEAIRLNPQQASAYNNRANAWYQKTDYDRAIADYSEVLRLEPNSADVFRNRGDSWQGKKDYERAIADYDQTIRLDPKNAGAFNNRAGAKHRKGDAKGAEADDARARALAGSRP